MRPIKHYGATMTKTDEGINKALHATYGVLLLAALLCGCVHQAKWDFSKRFLCPERDTSVHRLGGDYVSVIGCGKTKIYACGGGRCVLDESASAENADFKSRSAKPRDARQSVQMDNEKGKSVLKTVVKLDKHKSQMTLLASLDSDPKHIGIQVSRSRYNKDGDEECDLQIMTKFGLLNLPDTRHFVDGTKRLMRLKIPHRDFFLIAGSDYVVLRACDHRWTMDAEQLNTIQRFALTLLEEIAVRRRDGRMEATSLTAPSGGWPPWNPPSSDRPSATTRRLASDGLFKILQPSVYTVDAKTKTGSSQGSAVAVTSTRLLTNCHVLENALDIVLTSGSFKLKVKLIASDPDSDRCVIEVTDAEIKPVPGIRAFDKLKVGETVFALGAPKGLEHTFSEGIVSSKRFSGKAAYVQTTAAISPGSSGGGLFDQSGNLIGITTLALVDRERLSQALNFALAADRFWNSETIKPEEDSNGDKEDKGTKQFDPDTQLEIGEVRLRLAGDIDISKSRLLLLLQRNMDRERWNRCELKLVNGKDSLNDYFVRKIKGYKVHYRIRGKNKDTSESVQLKISKDVLKTWIEKENPRIRLCSYKIGLEGENLEKLGEAIARFEALTTAPSKKVDEVKDLKKQ